MFDLYNRRIANEDPENADIELEDIDYSSVDEVIKKEAEKSTSFILNTIRDLENKKHTPLITDQEK